jgi:hypothetical protein
MKQISTTKFAKDFLDWLPEFITTNSEIIGLQDFTGYKKLELVVKFLAYVAYFNLSVITQRQFQKSSMNVTKYENNPLESDRERVDTEEEQVVVNEKPIEVKFSLVFIIYKLKSVWPILDFFAWNMFTCISVTVMLLAVFWKLSVFTACYLLVLAYYYIMIPIKLQPNMSSAQIKKNEEMNVHEVKKLWETEKLHGNKTIISFKNNIIVFVIFLTIIFILLLHLSANLQQLKITYQERSSFWEDLTFYTFFAGVNYTEEEGGNTYMYEIYGYLVILILCVLERKSEIWLSSKFGFLGSKYDTKEFRFKLERYGSEMPVAKRKVSNQVRAGDLEIIEEEKEDMYGDELRKSKKNGESIRNGMEKEEENVEEVEDPEEQANREFEAEKKKKVKSILAMDYSLRICKGIRIFLYMLIILIALLAVVQKSNIFAVLILFAAIVTSFKGCNYYNLKWFSLFMLFIMMIEYLSALSNLSTINSPSVFPSPFDDRGVERPIKVPFYRELGDPITELVKSGPDQGDRRATKWAFYLGFLISTDRLNYLWLDWIIIILLNYFFVYFYSISYELGVDLNTQDTLFKAVQRIDNEVEESMHEKMKESIVHNDSIQDLTANGSRSGSVFKRKNMERREVLDYVQKVKKHMLVFKIYNSFSVGISAASTIVSLVCLLMIAFQVQGLINMFYICFCLYFITQSINFIYQNNWNFPLHLKRVLKPIVIFEIMLQILYQIPVEALHKGEDDPKGWQKIIGFYPIWRIGTDFLPESISTSNVIYK